MSAIIFVTSLVLIPCLVPITGALVGAARPTPRRRRRALEPVDFGVSQKARRSPRHAVLLHRGLMGSFFTALVALAILPAATRLGELGLSLIPVALAFTLPSLLVALHARRRARDEAAAPRQGAS